jgi:hypothetical protein
MATSDFSNIGLINFMVYGSFCILFMIFVLYSESVSSPILMFVILSYVLQVALNTAASSNKLVCDKTDPGSAIFFTLVPWIFILGVGNAALYYFPGWLRVFANSFGMWFAYHLKEEDFTSLESDLRNSSSTNEEFIQLYRKLVLNPKSIINEVDFVGKTDSQIIQIYKQLEQINPTIFGKLTETDPDPTKSVVFIQSKKDKEGTEISPQVKISKRADNIIKTIKKKNKVGFLIWNILLGTIASMISTNSLINAGCKINLL